MAERSTSSATPAGSNAPHRPRRSTCADASREAQLERVRVMTVTERINTALSMKQRFHGLKPVAVPPSRP